MPMRRAAAPVVGQRPITVNPPGLHAGLDRYAVVDKLPSAEAMASG